MSLPGTVLKLGCPARGLARGLNTLGRHKVEAPRRVPFFSHPLPRVLFLWFFRSVHLLTHVPSSTSETFSQWEEPTHKHFSHTRSVVIRPLTHPHYHLSLWCSPVSFSAYSLHPLTHPPNRSHRFQHGVTIATSCLQRTFTRSMALLACSFYHRPPLVIVLSLLLFSHAYSPHQLNHPANQSPILFSHGLVVTLSHSHRSAHLAFYILIVPPTTDSLSPLPPHIHRITYRSEILALAFSHALTDLIFISSACNRLPAHSPTQVQSLLVAQTYFPLSGKMHRPTSNANTLLFSTTQVSPRSPSIHISAAL